MSIGESITREKLYWRDQGFEVLIGCSVCAEFCCNGTVVEDPELGKVIQLQGDQRKNVSTFLVSNNIAKKDLIKIHGF